MNCSTLKNSTGERFFAIPVTELATDCHIRKFELQYVKDLASSTLAAGGNYMKCSHRSDAIEKCTKKGDWYESFTCPRPETDPTLVCATGRWYFSNDHPHESEMAAIRSIETFGSMHGFTFDKQEMLLEMYNNYEKFGNDWADKDWGFLSMEGGQHISGFHIPVCVSEDNQYDTFTHQRPWHYNWFFPTNCGSHAGNETGSFMRALGMGPGTWRHTSKDVLWADRIPRVSIPPYVVSIQVLSLLGPDG
jgi:hypothetical protein